MFDIKKIVKDYDIITIFRHTSADPDAMGSQFAMKYYLKTVFPEKEIYCLGDDIGGCDRLFPSVDHVEDAVIENSIALILDCANSPRVDDQRYSLAKKTVKIDHHPDVDDFTDEKYVDTTAAATCQILTELFKNDDENVNFDCAYNLYLGLLADTMDFTTTNTTYRSFDAASYLLKKGVDPNEVKEIRSGISLKQFQLLNFIRENVILDGNVGYAILKSEDYEKMGFTYTQVKEQVSCLGNVNEFKVWALFTENPEEKTYAGSFRSKKAVIINDIAAKWNGGGHPNACGAKGFTLETIKEIVKDFNDKINTSI